MNPISSWDDRPLRGPVLIGGAGRSGKTLLRWILNSHPAFAVSRRTEIWPRYRGRFGDLSDPERFARCVDALLSRRQVAAMRIDRARLERDFGDGPATYERLFALLHEQYAARLGKPRWGDQSEGIERFADDVLAAYPGAKIVHLIRDPRDRFAALRQARPGRSSGLCRSTATWLSSASIAERNARRYPDNYRVLRYETLVAKPSQTISALCGVLGEEPIPEMLTMPDARRYDDLRAEAPDGIPITDADVGRFHGELSPIEVAFVQAAAGRPMRRWGYAITPTGLRGGERLGFAVELPIGLAQVGSARTLDALRARRGRRSADRAARGVAA
jgi:hypothetical protein